MKVNKPTPKVIQYVTEISERSGAVELEVEILDFSEFGGTEAVVVSLESKYWFELQFCGVNFKSAIPSGTLLNGYFLFAMEDFSLWLEKNNLMDNDCLRGENWIKTQITRSVADDLIFYFLDHVERDHLAMRRFYDNLQVAQKRAKLEKIFLTLEANKNG